MTPATALLVIDVQNDFCPGGALAVPDGDAVVPIINSIAERFACCVFTQDWHPAGHTSFASEHPGHFAFETISLAYGDQVLWPDHCVQGSLGAEFHPDLDLSPASLIIRKGTRSGIDSYSAFFENDQRTSTGLSGYLRELGVQRVLLAGLATDFCVAFSALDARKEGFEAGVLERACRAIDLDGSGADTWARMEAAGVARLESVP